MHGQHLTSSLQELLGHCTALYSNNRHMASQLSQHLKSAGCSQLQQLQQPADPVLAAGMISSSKGAARLPTLAFNELPTQPYLVKHTCSA